MTRWIDEGGFEVFEVCCEECNQIMGYVNEEKDVPFAFVCDGCANVEEKEEKSEGDEK